MIDYFIKTNFKFFLFFFTLLICDKIVSQVNVVGKIYNKNGALLVGSKIKLLNSDSVIINIFLSDLKGEFNIPVIENKTYLLEFTYLNYQPYYKTIEVKNKLLEIDKIILKEDLKMLSEIEIKTIRQRGEQKGDTILFNADAFKTNPDATVEDLIKKMPGFSSDNNGVKVNGETIQKITVDGKTFFGDDANASLKNLPADIIDKVEVFDKMSDQSVFTGFNDGDQQKAINLTTKKGRNFGKFGKIYSGFGSDETQKMRYSSGATLNSFTKSQRLSLILLSNNINQQNFSLSDITGALGNSNQNNSFRGQGGGGSARQDGNSSFLTSPQNGNTTTQSAGLNYSDEWGKKIIVSGSYFYNLSNNDNSSGIVRNYFTTNILTYTQNNDEVKNNDNHRFNIKFEYAIDSFNKLIISPNFNFQNTIATSIIKGVNFMDAISLSSTSTTVNNINKGYDFSNSILYQHKFKKQGRTISLNLNTQLVEKENNGDYISNNTFNEISDFSLNQKYTAYSYNKKGLINLSYTEPINDFNQFQITYITSITEGKSNKITNDYDSVQNKYIDFNNLLSNKYNTNYQTQKVGFNFKYRKENLNWLIGIDYQEAVLKGDQTFPIEFSLKQEPFLNILPNAMLNYKLDKSKNIRLNYRTNTNVPSISQLQNVIDISNPLQIKSGNELLEQTFENNLSIRYGYINPTTSHNTMVYMNTNYINNFISNTTEILKTDTLIQGFEVKAGSQLTKPINLDAYYLGRIYFVYGFPMQLIKSNLNINGGINYIHTPSIINKVLNFSSSYAPNFGLYIGSNLSESIDFSIGYSGTYTLVKNSKLVTSDNNFFTHSVSIKINSILFKRFVINTDFGQNLYSGLSQNFNQDYFIWNAYIGYKFLKNKRLELKVSVFDILNQNRSINRIITGFYSEDSRTQVLKRYALFSLTYTLKSFNKESLKMDDKIEEREYFRKVQ